MSQGIPIGFSKWHDSPPSLIEVAKARLESSGYRVGATRTYRVPQPSAALASATQTSPIQLKWNANGIVVAAYGQVQSALDADMAAMSARIQISGTEDLITDGGGGAFGTFSALFGKTQNWYPISRMVYTGQIWNITFKNERATGDTILPDMFFGIVEEEPPFEKSR